MLRCVYRRADEIPIGTIGVAVTVTLAVAFVIASVVVSVARAVVLALIVVVGVRSRGSPFVKYPRGGRASTLTLCW